MKAQQPDAVLFFRLGDFYETFDSDAELVSRELGIMLTSKPMGQGLRVPLAGVPVRSVEQHLGRLLRRGHRVAICEQLEDPKATKGLVARGVVRVLSPGTALEPALLEDGRNSYCAAITGGVGERVGLAYVDLSTGEFRVAEFAGADAQRRAWGELGRIGAVELLLPEGAPPPAFDPERVAGDGQPRLTYRPTEQFGCDRAAGTLSAHYGLAYVEGLGLSERPAGQAAAGALLQYLLESHAITASAAPAGALPHLGRPRLSAPDEYMALDRGSEWALGLLEDRRAADDGPAAAPSLLSVLDRTRTALGRRLLRRRLRQPLLDLERIERRLDEVELLVGDSLQRERLGATLGAVPDLERLLARVGTGLATPAELARLGQGLAAAGALQGLLTGTGTKTGTETGPAAAAESGRAAERLRAGLDPCRAAEAEIGAMLEAEPAPRFDEGGVVREGADREVDRLRASLQDGLRALAELERRERERSGIANLKVGYHRSFGYYLEVSGSQLARTPADYERRQSLVNGARFVTTELRRLEAQVLEAREGLAQRERRLFGELCQRVGAAAGAIHALAEGVARLDVARSLAEVAVERGYCRPRLDRGDALRIRTGRHPVLECALPPGHYVPNDLDLCAGGAQILVLTGPNMAGKSTYLRQAALIVLLAQIGGFVPAEEAQIGLVDRIFTRVGAQDEIAAGRSTFMVEMLETAAILSGAGPRSLIVLDEIGRGTSTYDGLAIARAVLEQLAADPLHGPRTLFATHYHELIALAGAHERIVNANVAVSEDADGLRFLYRIVPGGADRSYGIHVAALAGLPEAVVARAQAILRELEAGSEGGGGDEIMQSLAALPTAPQSTEPQSIGPCELARELAALDVEGLTPLEAINALSALRESARDEIAAEGEGSACERLGVAGAQSGVPS